MIGRKKRSNNGRDFGTVFEKPVAFQDTVNDERRRRRGDNGIGIGFLLVEDVDFG